jgi:hypothetical protein
MVRGLPIPVTNTGGRGCWIGRGQILTAGCWWKRPFQANTSGSLHALSTSSMFSSNRSRVSAGGTPLLTFAS